MNLADKHCKKCGPGTPALNAMEAGTFLGTLPQWRLESGGTAIARDFVFDTYWAGLGFVNAIAWMAQQQGHHPDMALGYKKVKVLYSTDAAKGLTENDFICAAKVDQLSA